MKEDLVGQRFGRLTVIAPSGSNKRRELLWDCVCDCDTNKVITCKGINLKNNRTKSCGCYGVDMRRKGVKKANKKFNTYDLAGEYGVGYTFNNEEFYFDLEDYEKVRYYCWHINEDGYVVTNTVKSWGGMHRIIYDNPDIDVDHIFGVRNDNRKSQIRVISHQDNIRNHKIFSNNSSGVCGVHWDKSKERWIARVFVYSKPIYCGSYSNKEEAIIARLKAEKEYYGEFAPQKELFKEYNI